MGKLIIFSAPSGAGKSTIVNYLLSQNLNLQFSISATSRLPRGTEKHGVEYYFHTPEDFRQKIQENEFLEYEEVYKDKFYGTLKSEVQRILDNGGNVIFDVDVVGGCNIKKQYGDKALSIFIEPPSIEELRRRLLLRGTDSPELIEARVNKAEEEMTFAPLFDIVIRNDNLEDAKAKALKVVKDFIGSE
jgi:guanylate kinase